MIEQRAGGSGAPWILAGFAALLINTAYLTAYATPTLFYFVAIGVHVVLGLVLAAGFARWLVGGRPRNPWLLASAGLLFLGLIFGLTILHWGATRPYRWLLHAHIGLSSAGAALLIGYLTGVAARLSQPRARRWAFVSLALIGGVLVAAAGARLRYDTTRASAYRIENPAVVPASMEHEGGGPASPFFPSAAETDVGTIIPANFFLTSEGCGRCHSDIYQQWQSSAHRFSSFNNQWYRKSIEYMQDVVGTKPSKWCAGCHDHAVFFNGRFDRPIREQIETPEAQAGLGCTSCHAVTAVKSTMGQGDFVIEYPPLHDLATSEQPALRYLHDKLLAIDPQPHRETFLKPFHREQTAEFCSSCHKVHLDVPVNGYRWFRGFNDYDNWQASGVSGQGARSFYYPETPQKCADCHMPLVPSDDPAARAGRVRSHRFPAANTALPFVNRDAVQLKAVQDFLRDGQISVDIFGLVRGEASEVHGGQRSATGEPVAASTFAVGEESLNFGAAQAILTPPSDVLAPLDRVACGSAAGRVSPARGRRAHEKGRAFLSRRDRRCLRRVGRARGVGRPGTGHFPQRQRRRRGTRSGGAWRPLLP